MTGANGGSFPGGNHPNISTPSHPQGQHATTTPTPNSNNIGIIVAGVVVPLILITLGSVLIYAWYRKKYPVRMVIGKDFNRFTNPAYNKRASTLTLVRADANIPTDDPSNTETEGYVNRGLTLVREDDFDEVFNDEQANVEIVNETVEAKGNETDDKMETSLTPDQKNTVQIQAINIARERPRRALLIKSEDFEEKDFDMITESDLGQRTESELSSGNDSTDTHTISLSFSDTFDRKSSRAASNTEQIQHSTDKSDLVAVSGSVQMDSVDAKIEISPENNSEFVMVNAETDEDIELEKEQIMEIPVSEQHISERPSDFHGENESKDTEEMKEIEEMPLADRKSESEMIQSPDETINFSNISVSTVENSTECNPENINSNPNKDDNTTTSYPESKEIDSDAVVAEPSDELECQTVNDLNENAIASFLPSPIIDNASDISVSQSPSEQLIDSPGSQLSTIDTERNALTVAIEEVVITDAMNDIAVNSSNAISENWNEDIGNDQGDLQHLQTEEEPLYRNPDGLHTQAPADVVSELEETGTVTPKSDISNGSENKRPSLSLSRENVYLENTPPTPVVLVQDSIIFESDAGSPIHLDRDTVVQGRERRAFTLDENLQREQAPNFHTNARVRHSFDGQNLQGSSSITDFRKVPALNEKQPFEQTDEDGLSGINLSEQINNEAKEVQRMSPDVNESLLGIDTSEKEIVTQNTSSSTEQDNIDTNYGQNENSFDEKNVIPIIPEDAPPQSPANETPQQDVLLDLEDRSKDDVLFHDLEHSVGEVSSSTLSVLNEFTNNQSPEYTVNPVLDPILIPSLGEESEKLGSNSENSALVQIESSEMTTPSSDSSETLSFELIGEDSSSHKSSDMQSNFSEISMGEDTKTPEGRTDNVLTRIAVDPFSFDFEDPVIPDLSQTPACFDDESIEKIQEDQETESSQLEQSRPIGSPETSVNMTKGDLSWDLISNTEDSQA